MIPNATKRKYLQGEIDYENDTFYALLLNDTTTFSPNADTYEFVSDILADGEEYSDTNYQRVQVTGLQVTQDDSSNEVRWSADDMLWEDLGSQVGQTIQTVVVFRNTSGGPTDDDNLSDVIRIMDDSEEDELPIATNGSNIVIEWDPSGIKRIS